jgi:nitrogen PTS system EIIA component
MNLSDLISTDTVIPSLTSQDKVSVLAELVEPLCRQNKDLDPDRLVRILIEREKLGSTGIGDGIAIPHGKVDQTESLLVSFGRSVQGIDFDSMDGKPAHLFFLLLAPETSAGSHLTALAKLSRLLKNSSVREKLMEAEDSDTIHQLIMDYEEGA